MTVLVYAVFGDADAAQAAAWTVVEERLAACANIFAPCTSVYRWQGKIAEGEEVPVLFKTSAAQREALMARLVELHGYEVPAILSWNANAAHAPFAAWIENETQQD